MARQWSPRGTEFGDVFSVALAKVRGLPLLFSKGDDFAEPTFSLPWNAQLVEAQLTETTPVLGSAKAASMSAATLVNALRMRSLSALPSARWTSLGR